MLRFVVEDDCRMRDIGLGLGMKICYYNNRRRDVQRERMGGAEYC